MLYSVRRGVAKEACDQGETAGNAGMDGKWGSTY